MLVKTFAILLCLTIAYISAGSVLNCPDYPGVGKIKVGESKSVHGTCALATCNDDGSIVMKGCPEFVVIDPCIRLPENLTALYPDCCPAPFCPPKKN